MNQDDSRNTVIFVVAALLMFLAYNFFVLEPQSRAREAQAKAEAAAAAKNPAVQRQAPGAAPAVQATVAREAAVAATPRVPIATPELKGSLSLRGARIDDLYMAQYRETVDKNSPPVELLRPEGAQYAFFADMGWVGANVPGLPNEDTIWTLTQGSVLAPGRPVTLSYDNGQGLRFTRQIAVDDKFLFTVTDRVANLSPQSLTLAPYGSVQRHGVPPELLPQNTAFQGGTGWLGELRLINYRKWQKDITSQTYDAAGGWIGITDKYWLTAFIPGGEERFRGEFRKTARAGANVLDANFVGQSRVIPSGREVTAVTHLFAGAKRVPLLQGYEESVGAKELDRAVDWGRLWFLTRPFFSFLSYLYGYLGNFGMAILALTVVVKLVMFPIANKQFESATKMKAVQPQMEELRKKFKDDPQRQQQELLALYQREKVNPLAGCLPILLTIPIFFALFKVLSITIEMRHAPFVGWITDLAGRDPTTIWNLFGLIPWDPASAPLVGGFLDTTLHLGILPILYGFTTWLTMALNPPAPDPMQQRIFQLMPIFFTFIMAQFASGLLVYYTWSNILTVLQQYVIMRRFKVDNPIDQLLRRFSGKPAPSK